MTEKENEKAFFSDMLGNRDEEKGFDVESRLERYGKAHKRALLQSKYILEEVVPQCGKVLG